jgi:hypothetical protein
LSRITPGFSDKNGRKKASLKNHVASDGNEVSAGTGLPATRYLIQILVSRIAHASHGINSTLTGPVSLRW